MPRSLDKCTKDISLPRYAALDGILKRCRFSPGVEDVRMPQALGRVVAKDLISRNTLPNTLTASRDGVAIYYDKFKNGVPDTSGWIEGRDYVYANTGIGIDGNYDTEILIEEVFFDKADRIRFMKVPECKGHMTIEAGTEMRIGDRLAWKGQILTPPLLALLAKGGHTQFPVVKKPVVSFIPTGSELVPAGEALPLGKNVDANSVLIWGKLLEWGAEPIIFPICRDDHGKFKTALMQAIERSDIVLVNAGSSKGTDDINHEVLSQVGEMLNQQVNTGPGKHTSYTVAGNVPVVGLSGPTTCCDYTSEWYVKPIIDRFLGRPPTKFPVVKAHLLTELTLTKESMIFMMGARVMRDEKDQLVVTPVSRLVGEKHCVENKVNCFIPMCPGFHARKGDEVEVELRWPFVMPSRQLKQIAELDKDPVVF